MIMKDLFPTGKPHVSFSEVKIWKECSYRHKLAYIDKIDVFEPSPYLDFGTAVHEGCESILKTGTVNKVKLLNDITSAWEKNGFDDTEWVSRQPSWYKYHNVDTWCTWAENMWLEVPDFLDSTFPGWECFNAEEQLYESIDTKDVIFKGFIDGVLKVPKCSGGYKYWIIDWKTSQSYGWRRDKKQDILMTAQLILYKHFWSKKHNIPLKDIGCGFVLLKRGGKLGNVCELVNVASGPKSLSRAVKIVNNMIASVKNRIHIKNRNSCRFCPYKDTQHCT